MFQRILVANRGEIALRILRAAHEMGVETVAVYSEADEGVPYLDLADETICIGPGASGASYLSIPNIISAAEVADVDAIHPGYGFLAENASFAETCRESRIEFIGPSQETLRLCGDKASARELAVKHKVPVVPGSPGLLQDPTEAVRVAAEIGFPVLLKATAGGGGRGMRVAHNDMSLVHAFHQARSEAEGAFGDDGLYVEKYLENPRHVEIQVVGDSAGSVIQLGERECSVQRRHQKLLEEAPSPELSRDLRKAMGRAAVRIAKAAKYVGAGTVEFLVDGRNFYFIEVNARIQVEHPVTEMITGIDLLKEQIRVAAGDKLRYEQNRIRWRGHAIEVRVNAEDPDRDFAPSPGRITHYVQPGGPGIRVDTHVFGGYTVPPHYDSLIAKLIVHGESRAVALDTLRRALGEYVIEGIKTTIPLLREIVGNSYFIKGEYDTGFLSEFFSL